MSEKQPEALRLADWLFDNVEHINHADSAAELRRLHHHTEVLRAERDRARSCYDATVKLMAGIHALLYPAPTTMPDGRVMVFRPKSLDPHEVLQELSDRIRALPDELEKVAALQRAEAKTDEPVAQVKIAHYGGRSRNIGYSTIVPLIDPANLPVNAYLYTHPAPGVPDGYVLVPIVPTKEMLEAGDAEDHWHTELIYAAMLAASPAQKGGECLPIRGNQVTCSRGTGGCGIQHKGGD